LAEFLKDYIKTYRTHIDEQFTRILQTMMNNKEELGKEVISLKKSMEKLVNSDKTVEPVSNIISLL